MLTSLKKGQTSCSGRSQITKVQEPQRCHPSRKCRRKFSLGADAVYIDFKLRATMTLASLAHQIAHRVTAVTLVVLFSTAASQLHAQDEPQSFNAFASRHFVDSWNGGTAWRGRSGSHCYCGKFGSIPRSELGAARGGDCEDFRGAKLILPSRRTTGLFRKNGCRLDGPASLPCAHPSA